MGVSTIIENVKDNVLDIIDEYKNHYLSVGKDIYKNPETGYKEFRTTEKLVNLFTELGLNTIKDIAYTGSVLYFGIEDENLGYFI